MPRIDLAKFFIGQTKRCGFLLRSPEEIISVLPSHRSLPSLSVVLSEKEVGSTDVEISGSLDLE